MRNEAIELYLNSVESNLICKKMQRKRIIESISSELYEFCDSNSVESAYGDIVDRFGKSEELALSFLKNMDGAELKTRLSNKKLAVIAIVVGTIIAVSAIIICVKCYQRWEFFAHPDGYEVAWPIYELETEEEVSEYYDIFDE